MSTRICDKCPQEFTQFVHTKFAFCLHENSSTQKYDEISKLFLTLLNNKIWRFHQILVAFSEYKNFILN